MIELDINYINNGLMENNTIFLTITNDGYSDYTKNMLKSLGNLNLDKKILIMCLDNKSNEYFKSNGYFTYCININLTNFTEFGTNDFAKFGYIKLWILNQLILKNYNILYTDSDIYYNKNPFTYIQSLYNEEGDIWIQNDTIYDDNYQNLCTGFMYIRSNNSTKKYFNIDYPEFTERYKYCTQAADQTYINLYVTKYLNTKLLPLKYFPNGNYFYNFENNIKENNILVHFNWVVGHQKKERMKKYGMWLI